LLGNDESTAQRLRVRADQLITSKTITGISSNNDAGTSKMTVQDRLKQSFGTTDNNDNDKDNTSKKTNRRPKPQQQKKKK
jgi:hypothetical protein